MDKDRQYFVERAREVRKIILDFQGGTTNDIKVVLEKGLEFVNEYQEWLEQKWKGADSK